MSFNINDIPEDFREIVKKELGDKDRKIGELVNKKPDIDIDAIKKAAKKELQEEAKLDAEGKAKKILEVAEATKKDAQKLLNKIKAESILVGTGMSKEDYAPLLENIVSDDLEKTEASAKALADAYTKNITKAKEDMKKDLMNQTPDPQTDPNKGGMSKEKFDKLNYSERTKLYDTDRETYNKFTTQ